MRKSGYRAVFQIYLIFFAFLVGLILTGAGLFLFFITVSRLDGSIARSGWPAEMTADFSRQVVFQNGSVAVRQEALDQLAKEGCWVQVLDEKHEEVYSFGKPQEVSAQYTCAELIRLAGASGKEREGLTGNGDGNENGIGAENGIGNGTTFLGTVWDHESEYIYLLHFPMKIDKVTMFFNGERFTNGKPVILLMVMAAFLAAAGLGLAYGLWITGAMGRLADAIRNMTKRCYIPEKGNGAFSDIYTSLNQLDQEMRESDRVRRQTDQMREEWIANITHDLKTPLSPIKGYAELLCVNDGTVTNEQAAGYAGIMLKNLTYAESLLDDLKLTYQLQSSMIPLHRQERNLNRFLKELVIDILNHPEYQDRMIHYACEKDEVLFAFDDILMTRVFHNLIINSFAHGEEDTEVALALTVKGSQIRLILSDNGKGMTEEEKSRLFDRYYRGTGAGHKREGTGLGLAIARQIVELHDGTITVMGAPGCGTSFDIIFPQVKVN